MSWKAVLCHSQFTPEITFDSPSIEKTSATAICQPDRCSNRTVQLWKLTMTKATTLRTALLATLFAGFATAAMAQEIEFEDLDTDGDGMLSMEEVTDVLPDISEDQLTIADANGDGMIDEVEYEVLSGE
jgi:hypothetical protein